jgi:hypothetical protein
MKAAKQNRSGHRDANVPPVTTHGIAGDLLLVLWEARAGARYRLEDVERDRERIAWLTSKRRSRARLTKAENAGDRGRTSGSRFTGPKVCLQNSYCGSMADFDE